MLPQVSRMLKMLLKAGLDNEEVIDDTKIQCVMKGYVFRTRGKKLA